jgi:hypothetical protein
MNAKVIDLVWCMARLDVHNKKLTIVSASDASENAYTPAESVVVYGEAGLLALRDALNEAYPVVPND